MAKEPTTAAIINLLEQGTLELEGRVPWGSNYTFLVRISHDSEQVGAIYKPSQGERPLWDFTRGSLCRRERAAFVVSEQLGWGLVPPTVMRDGPHGRGSLQYFVEHDPEQHYFTLQGSYVEQEQQVALFDVIINNADRKSGHVILSDGDRLWAIDNGLSFHADYKLRSVIWEYAGEPIQKKLLDDLVAFQSWLCYGNDVALEELGEIINPREMEALKQRLERLIEKAIFPRPGPGRHYPWPLV
jgi:hypothetical protein